MNLKKALLGAWSYVLTTDFSVKKKAHKRRKNKEQRVARRKNRK